MCVIFLPLFSVCFHLISTYYMAFSQKNKFLSLSKKKKKKNWKTQKLEQNENHKLKAY